MELGENSRAWTKAGWSFVKVRLDQGGVMVPLWKFTGLDQGEVMELGENSRAWTMALCWSFAKIHGLGPWRGDGVW